MDRVLRMTSFKKKIFVWFHYQVAFNNTDQKIVFWEGSARDIDSIPNPAARKLAKEAIAEKQNKKLGIWRVWCLE